MTDGLFDSAWLKWAWAVVHAEALKAQVDAFGEDLARRPLAPIGREYDPKKHCISISFAEVPDLPVQWPVRFGDVLHNYRSSLDHLAWSLVSRGRTPPATLPSRKRTRIRFPICDTRGAFNGEAPQALPGISRSDGATVRRAQPYRAGETRTRLHCLTVLRRLSNQDKHRAVHPLIHVPYGGTVEVLGTHDCTVTRISRGFTAPTEIGAEIQRIYVRKTGPNPDVDLEYNLTLLPAVDKGLGLVEWLDKTRDYIKVLLRQFSEPPEYVTS